MMDTEVKVWIICSMILAILVLYTALDGDGPVL